MPGFGEDGYYNEYGTFYKHVWSKKLPGVQASNVWAEVLTQSGSKIYARDIELASIENMVITPETPQIVDRGVNTGVFVTKYIYKKDKPDNWASIWIWDSSSQEHSGSVWLNIDAFGP